MLTPHEREYLKLMLDGGLLPPSAARQLQAACESAPEAAGARPFAWDLAVEWAMVTPEQSAEVLDRLGPEVAGAEAAVEPQAEAAAETMPAEAEPAAVRKMLGSYELITRLGSGAMGAVYKARQPGVDRLVALKVLPRSLAQNQEYVQRFLREARAAGRLSHPNIVAGIDAGFADGYYYFAMEFVEGRNLGEALDRDGALDEKAVLEIGRQAAEALDCAGAAGLVHRDIKPENIIVAADGRAKLCDLGLARSADENLRLTQAGCTVGTPYYMAPEQLRGEPLDSRADLYSLGCTLYHLVCGRPPFEGSNALQLMHQHLNDTAPRAAQVRPGISRAFEAVLEKLMARAPADRYQTAREVADDLARVASGGIPGALTESLATRRRTGRRGSRAGTTDTRPAAPPAARAQGEFAADAEAETGAPAVRRHWGLIIAFGLVALTLGLTGFAWGLKTSAARDREELSRVEKLAERLETARAYEAAHPADFARASALYLAIAKESLGTDVAAEALAALDALEQRRSGSGTADKRRQGQ